jgi:hypothetical protein
MKIAGVWIANMPIVDTRITGEDSRRAERTR